MRYIHIMEAEQRRIERLLEAGESLRSIGRKLGRSVSTISDEIRRNRVRGKYLAHKAKHKARVRRKQSKIQCMRVAMDKDLRKYVTDQIESDQSPEGISGRLKCVEKDRPYVSAKAIYKFVHSVHGRKIEKHLYSKAVKKKGGPKRDKTNPMGERIMIDKRPEKVEKRREFGHFEGDFIESGKDGTGSLLVLVERKTRYPFVAYTEDRSTTHINQLIAVMLANTPVRSLTLDNDLSFQKHEELSELINSIVFFCHPYCSREKGTVENRNKAIRRYVPKRTDLSAIPEVRIREVEHILRTRFMKCLNFKTPQESWDEEIERFRQKNTPLGVMIVDDLLEKSVRLEG